MKMIIRCAFAALSIALFAVPSSAREIGGVVLPEKLAAGETPLQLNGGGVRSRFFIDLYVAGLYLKGPSRDGAKIANADEPMAIRLAIISGMITSEAMETATREGFVNSTGGNTAPIQKEIDSFINVFKSEIKVGDVYDLIYTPGKGVEVFKNGKSQSVTPGLPLKRALFGIWLGEKPAQKDLKEALLGG